MEKLGLLFVTIAMIIMISGCSDITKDNEEYSSSTGSLKSNSESSSTTSNTSVDSASRILSGNTYYVSKADNGYSKYVFDKTLDETSYTENGEVIETNTFSISYSGTTIKIEGVIYEVTKQTHSITIVGDGKTRVFWDAIEYAKGTDAESILSGKTFYYIDYEHDENDGYSYSTNVFTKDKLIDTSYRENGEVIETDSASIEYSTYRNLREVSISNRYYKVTRETNSVKMVTDIKGFGYIDGDFTTP